MRNIIVSVFLAGLLLGGCVTEYNHPGLEELGDILVVEGTITNDTTFIQLSYSVAINSETEFARVPNNATVTVETENGAVYRTESPPENGRFSVVTGELDYGQKYRLRIELDGLTYVSQFLEPLSTPEVNSLDLYKRGEGEPVQLRITSQNTEDGSPFYLWSFEEIWEYTAPFYSNAYQETHGGEIEVYQPYSPYYYCWSFDKSNSLLLASTVKLSSNKVENFSLASLPANSLRFTYLYYVRVRQNCIREAAYNYFSNIKANAESTGSIFGPIPSEMKGNITCVSDESIPVIGYVDVSQTVIYEQYFDSFREISEYRSPSSCISFQSKQQAVEAGYEELWTSMFVYFYFDDDTMDYSFRRCIDCRVSGDGYHDRKPWFWPNDHI